MNRYFLSCYSYPIRIKVKIKNILKNSLNLISQIFKIQNTMLVCLSVRLYQINVKTAKPIGHIFLLDLTWPPEKEARNYKKKNCLWVFDFYKILKMFKNIIKSANLFYYCFINPISAGVLENQDMLGGVNLTPPSKSHVWCPKHWKALVLYS